MFAIRGWILHLLDVINKEKTLLDEMRYENHPAITLLNEIFQIAQEKAASIKLYISFPSELEKACATANLSLDRDARHPNYKFERGFLQLYIDYHKKTAKLSNFESNKLFNIPAEIIFERPFDDISLLVNAPINWKSIPKNAQEYEQIFHLLFEQSSDQSIYQTLLPFKLQLHEFIQDWLNNEMIAYTLKRLSSSQAIELQSNIFSI